MKRLIMCMGLLAVFIPMLGDCQTAYKSYIGKEDIGNWDGVTSTFNRRTSTGGSLTLHSVGDAVDVAQVYGGGTASQTALTTAIATIGSRNVTIELAPGTWSLTSAVTVPKNITLRIHKGALVTQGTGGSLTINGPFDAGFHQVFSGFAAGEITFGKGYVGYTYPQWWGAVGDGATDSTLAIQCAIQSGIATKITDGTWMTDQNTMPSGTIIEGSGYNSVLKLNANKLQSVLINSALTATGNSNITIRNLRIDGNRANNVNELPATNGACIELQNVDYPIIENCWLHGARLYGIMAGYDEANIGPTNRMDFSHNYVYDNGVAQTYGGGIVVVNGNNITIADNQVYDNFNVAIRLEWNTTSDTQSYLSVHHNHIKADKVGGIDNYGITLEASNAASLAEGSSIDHNIIQSCSTGISAYYTTGGHFNISHNFIKSAALTGISVIDSANQLTLIGNIIKAPTRYGISTYSSSYNQDLAIIGNIVSSAGYDAIHLQRVKNSVVANNIIRDPSQGAASTYSGIWFTATSGADATGNIVTGNSIIDTTSKMAYGIGGNPGTGNIRYNVIANNYIKGAQTGDTTGLTTSSSLTGNYGESQMNMEMPFGTLVLKNATTTMTGNGTFTQFGGNVYFLDPGGSNRNFNPSGGFNAGTLIIVVNKADAAETITFDSSGLAASIAQNERGIFAYDGSAWKTIVIK